VEPEINHLAAMSTSVVFDERAICSHCGCYGAFLFAGETLCGECYEKRSACCAEFAGNDLTTRDCEKEAPAPKVSATRI